MSPFLEISNMTVSYGSVRAVHQLSLTVEKGEIIALLGANGAGKSTTAQAIVGWAEPSEGQIIFDGREITGMRTEDIVRLGLTLVPQGRQVFTKLTVDENLTLGGLARRAGVSDDDVATEVLDMFSILRDRRRQQAGNLSGGEQQQLVIARALMSGPRFVIFDEPSLGLAPKVTASMFELIADLRARGLTIMIVEQNVGLALDICDRAYVLGGGQVRLSGDPETLRQSEELQTLFLGARRNGA